MILFAASFFAAWTRAATADVYMYRDSKGALHYSNAPSEPGSEMPPLKWFCLSVDDKDLNLKYHTRERRWAIYLHVRPEDLGQVEHRILAAPETVLTCPTREGWDLFHPGPWQTLREAMERWRREAKPEYQRTDDLEVSAVTCVLEAIYDGLPLWVCPDARGASQLPTQRAKPTPAAVLALADATPSAPPTPTPLTIKGLLPDALFLTGPSGPVDITGSKRPTPPRAQDRRAAYLRAHLELSEGIRQAIAAGKPLVAMSTEDMLACCGPPMDETHSESSEGHVERWQYGESGFAYGFMLYSQKLDPTDLHAFCFFTFVDDRLVVWECPE